LKNLKNSKELGETKMATLTVSDELMEVLESMKSENESYEDVIWTLVNQVSDTDSE
jgi:predicted CopG family antitoxin